MLPGIPRVEPCAGSYRAFQVSGTIVLVAHGVHPAAGYHTFWDVSHARDRAPEFSLWHLPPPDAALQVLTPFAVCVSIQSTEDLQTIVVHDASGAHRVAVSPLPEAVAAHAP